MITSFFLNSQDLNECMQAALNGSSLCSANSESLLILVAHTSVTVVPGYDLTNGTFTVCYILLRTVNTVFISVDRN